MRCPPRRWIGFLAGACLSLAQLPAQITWNNGEVLTVLNPPTVGVGDTLNIDTGGNHDIDAKTLTNNGTINWTSGYIRGWNGSVILNSSGATFNDLNVSGYTIYNPVGGTFIFTNNGTYLRNTTGTTYFDVPFDNNGLVDLQQGQIQFRAGGILSSTGEITAAAGTSVLFTGGYTIQSASSLSGAGTFQLTGGTLDIDGTVSVGNFIQVAGALAGSQVFTDTVFTWNDGVWDAASTGPTTVIGPTSILHIASGTNHDLRRRAVTNQGTVNWTSGYIRGGDGSTFTNAAGATFNDLNASGYTFYNPYGSGTFIFTNNGTYLRNTTGTTYFDIPFDNNGTVQLVEGSLELRAGATLASTSQLSFVLAGPASGSDYGLLTISTALALQGTLDLQFAGGFASVATFGQTFTLLNSSSLSGSFLNVSNGGRLVSSDGLGSFTVHYGAGSAFGANSVVLTGFEAVPEPSTWAFLLLGSGVVALGLRRRRA